MGRKELLNKQAMAMVREIDQLLILAKLPNLPPTLLNEIGQRVLYQYLDRVLYQYLTE